MSLLLLLQEPVGGIELEDSADLLALEAEVISFAPSGTLRLRPGRIGAASVTPAGALTRKIGKRPTATLAPAATLTRVASTVAPPPAYPAGQVIPAGSLTRKVTKRLLGTVTPRGRIYLRTDDLYTFFDNFDNNSLSASWNKITGTGTHSELEVNQRLELSSTGLAHASIFHNPLNEFYDLTSGSISARLVSTSTDVGFQSYMRLMNPPGGDNEFWFGIDDGNLRAVYTGDAGLPSETVVNTAYSATLHRFLRIRFGTTSVDSEYGGSEYGEGLYSSGPLPTVFFDTSANGITWTTQGSTLCRGNGALRFEFNLDCTLSSGSRQAIWDSFNWPEAGGVGTITPSGAISRKHTRILRGTITPAGVPRRKKRTTLRGATTPAGLFDRTLLHVLAATLIPTSVLYLKESHTVTGALTPASTLTFVPRDVVEIPAQIEPAGSLTLLVHKTIVSSVSPYGNFLNQDQRIGLGTLTPVGVLNRKAGWRPTAQISLSGSIVRILHKRLQGTITPNGRYRRNAPTHGTVAPAGRLAFRVRRSWGGGISPTGRMRRSTDDFQVFDGGVLTPGTITVGTLTRGAFVLTPITPGVLVLDPIESESES